MSTAVPNPIGAAGHEAAAGAHDQGHDGHDPHLAHHFDTREQQFASNKLGMWVFLATEILMFGGLFCAYAVYRHLHPEVFVYAHHYLSKPLGAINTVVLISSSLTMAWGVRAAQLGRQRLLSILLVVTLLGGFGFLAIKAIEYRSKWEHHLGVGAANRFHARYEGPEKMSPGTEGSSTGSPAGSNLISGSPALAAGQGGSAAGPSELGASGAAATAPTATAPGHTHAAAAAPADSHAHAGPSTASATASTTAPPDLPLDPNAGTTDAALIRPHAVAPSGLTVRPHAEHEAGAGHWTEEEAESEFHQMPILDQQRVTTFFQVYFLMTGLHGIHVVVGMALIFWLLLRAVTRPMRMWLLPVAGVAVGLYLVYLGILIPHGLTLLIGVGLALLSAAAAVIQKARSRRASAEAQPTFGPRYYAPVDIVGLYWHLVDLIWIFLFPLLYLIE